MPPLGEQISLPYQQDESRFGCRSISAQTGRKYEQAQGCTIREEVGMPRSTPHSLNGPTVGRRVGVSVSIHARRPAFDKRGYTPVARFVP